MEGEIFRRSVAEFVGIFALVFVGVGSVMTGGGLLAVAVAHGLILAIMVSALGHVSGGHLNPAVTFGFFVPAGLRRCWRSRTGQHSSSARCRQQRFSSGSIRTRSATGPNSALLC